MRDIYNNLPGLRVNCQTALYPLVYSCRGHGAKRTTLYGFTGRTRATSTLTSHFRLRFTRGARFFRAVPPPYPEPNTTDSGL